MCSSHATSQRVAVRGHSASPMCRPDGPSPAPDGVPPATSPPPPVTTTVVTPRNITRRRHNRLSRQGSLLFRPRDGPTRQHGRRRSNIQNGITVFC
ncbi:hypothetical protein E2C01_083419 [Portunus trituberculatus]|uniref:Uncharacterized protein n=1 Tax=Portunus trituberculatus TaxID=210409 RepID=A0A5B7J1Z1_PORTR|nr:hypothetical protein [Portunus trituberculatus]